MKKNEVLSPRLFEVPLLSVHVALEYSVVPAYIYDTVFVLTAYITIVKHTIDEVIG
jgi:hypothetical protein